MNLAQRSLLSLQRSILFTPKVETNMNESARATSLYKSTISNLRTRVCKSCYLLMSDQAVSLTVKCVEVKVRSRLRNVSTYYATSLHLRLCTRAGMQFFEHVCRQCVYRQCNPDPVNPSNAPMSDTYNMALPNEGI